MGKKEETKLKNNQTTLKLALTGLMAALCYVAFANLKIVIPLPNGDSSALHIGNAICIIAALILGGKYGGLAGSLGMTIADLVDPRYVTSAPKTFVLKFCIGLIAGYVAHNIGHITKTHDPKKWLKWSLLASSAALGFNVVMDPLVGYFYKRFFLGVNAEVADVIAKFESLTTFANAMFGIAFVVVVYLALRPALDRAKLGIEV